MPTREQCIQEIQQYATTTELLSLLEKIEANVRLRNNNQPPRQIHFLTDPTLSWREGYAWQYLVCRAFKLAGAKVHYEFSIKLSQVFRSLSNNALEKPDGCAEFQDWPITCLIEAKDQKAKTDADSVVMLRAGLRRRPPPVIGSLFSTSGFSEPARIYNMFEQNPPIMFWELKEVRDCLQRGESGIREGLEWKMRYLSMYGTPDEGIDFERSYE